MTLINVHIHIFFNFLKEELTQILGQVDSMFKRNCLGKIYIPIYQSKDASWDLPDNLEWAENEPNGYDLQKCALMFPDYKIGDRFCYTNGCPICKWKSNPTFILKGLCSDSKIEHRYVLRTGKTFNDMILFYGFTQQFYIVFDEYKNMWVLLKSLNNVSEELTNDSFQNNITIGTSGSPELPIGLHSWNFVEGKCNQTIQLKLTSVSHIPIHIYFFRDCVIF